MVWTDVLPAALGIETSGFGGIGGPCADRIGVNTPVAFHDVWHQFLYGGAAGKMLRHVPDQYGNAVFCAKSSADGSSFWASGMKKGEIDAVIRTVVAYVSF